MTDVIWGPSLEKARSSSVLGPSCPMSPVPGDTHSSPSHREWQPMEADRGRHSCQLVTSWDFPGGPVVKNSPSKAGNSGSIPGRGVKIPHALGQLSPCATTAESKYSGACAPQREKHLFATIRESLYATTKTQHIAKNPHKTQTKQTTKKQTGKQNWSISCVPGLVQGTTSWTLENNSGR